MSSAVSRDALEDDYELELVSAPSAEDIIMAAESTKETVNTFVELVSRVIEKSPKIGYAVLLLHTGVKGAEFYEKMRLAKYPGNRVRQEAEEILKGGLANFDVDANYVTKLPKHIIGQAAINSLRQYGVGVDHIVRGGDQIGIYFLEKKTSQRPTNVIYNRNGSAFALASATDFDWDEIFDGVTWFHFCGIKPANSV